MAVTIEPLDLSTMRRRAPIAWATLDATITHNDVGSWTITAPADDRNRALLGFDGDGLVEPLGVVIDWNGIATIVGLVEEANPDRKRDGDTLTQTITLSGGDMLALLANRIAYPDATKAWSGQAVASITGTAPPESTIKELITSNLIDAGDTARNYPGLTVAADLGRGGTSTWHITTPDPSKDTTTDDATVSTNLLAIWRAIEAQGSTRLGLRIDLVGQQLVADVYEPRDLHLHAVWSTALGNLSEASLSVENPSANAILMQSNVTGATFTQTLGKGTSDPWRRVEQFLDQSSTTTAADATQAATDAVTAGAAKTTLAATAVDTPRLRFGRDDPANGVTGYWPGDTVTVDFWDDLTYSDQISSVRLQADRTGDAYTETAVPSIGTTTDDNTITAALQQQLAALEQRMRKKGA